MVEGYLERSAESGVPREEFKSDEKSAVRYDFIVPRLNFLLDIARV